MEIYLITFSLSSFLLLLAEKGENKKFTKRLLVFLGLLLPTLLAGFRKVGVGTDTKVYVYVLYEAAKKSKTFFGYLGSFVYSNFQNKAVTQWEIGYNLLVYLSAKLTRSFQGVLFFTHALIIMFVYKGLKKLNGSFSIAFSMLSFYLMFYGTSLNLMRQWIAISILFYGFHFLIEKNIKMYLLTIVLATLFHNSGVIGILLLFLYYYIEKTNGKVSIAIGNLVIDKEIKKVLITFAVAVVLLLGLEIFASVLGSINGIFARYARIYISGTIKIMPMQIVRRIPILVILICNWKKIKQKIPFSGFLYVMFTLDLVASQLGGITNQSSRIGYYFSVYELILLPGIIGTQRKAERFLLELFFCLYYIFCFYYDMVLMGRAEIIPYLFYFQ